MGTDGGVHPKTETEIMASVLDQENTCHERTRIRPDAMCGRRELLAARKRIAELERKVGQQELELFFRRSLAAHKSGREAIRTLIAERPGKAASAWNECAS